MNFWSIFSIGSEISLFFLRLNNLYKEKSHDQSPTISLVLQADLKEKNFSCLRKNAYFPPFRSVRPQSSIVNYFLLSSIPLIGSICATRLYDFSHSYYDFLPWNMRFKSFIKIIHTTRADTFNSTIFLLAKLPYLYFSSSSPSNNTFRAKNLISSCDKDSYLFVWWTISLVWSIENVNFSFLSFLDNVFAY